MVLQQKLALALSLALSTFAAHATPLVYVLDDSAQFGTMDLSTGSFKPIGSGIPDFSGGLVPGPGGTLLTLTFSGNLDSINPSTGATTVVGATGLGDCSLPTSPCGPNSVNIIGNLGSKLYATDLANNLYSINPITGKATLIGSTGIPAISFIPLSPVPGDPDGSFHIYDESIFGAGGNLYINFDTGTFDPTTFTPTPVIDANLYKINTLTGLATLVGPTDFGLTSILSVGGSTYAFSGPFGEVLKLNVSNGTTSYVSNVDPSLGLIEGAAIAPVPEPTSLALVGSGLAGLAAALKNRRTH